MDIIVSRDMLNVYIRDRRDKGRCQIILPLLLPICEPFLANSSLVETVGEMRSCTKSVLIQLTKTKHFYLNNLICLLLGLIKSKEIGLMFNCCK